MGDNGTLLSSAPVTELDENYKLATAHEYAQVNH